MDGSRLATSLWERLYRESNDASLLPDRAEAHRRREEADRSPHWLIGRAYREEHRVPPGWGLPGTARSGPQMVRGQGIHGHRAPSVLRRDPPRGSAGD